MSNLDNNRLVKTWASLREHNGKGFLPYVTAGLPDLPATKRILETLADVGVTAVELGFPYSDPIADGPTIQTSFTRVLERGIHVNEILEMVRELRQTCQLPILGMLSFSIVHRIGVREFAASAAEAGIDGLILPDLSLEEAPQVISTVNEAGLCMPMLVSPLSPPERRRQIAGLSTGFVYYMSVTGITGERDQLPPELIENVRQLREMSGQPIVVGFGISTADHIRSVCREADGAIIGSALVRRIMQAEDEGIGIDGIVETVRSAALEWLEGTKS